MALVLIHGAQTADAPPISVTVHLHQLVVLRAHFLLQRNRRRNKLVTLQHGDAVMRLEVSRAVRRQAGQARRGGFVSHGPAAEITGDVERSRRSRRRRWFGSRRLQLLHNLQATKRNVVARFS